MSSSVLKKSHVFPRFLLLAISILFSASLFAAENACTKDFYVEINTELTKAYNELGKPAVSFRNLGIVKDMAVSRLESRSSSWPKDATFNISVLNDRISVATFCKDKTTQGEWRPSQK